MVENKFKKTTIGGSFKVIDLPDGSDLANGYFQRDVQIDGDIDISGEIINTSLTNQLNSKLDISDYLVTVVDISFNLSEKVDVSDYLIDLSNNVFNLSEKVDISDYLIYKNDISDQLILKADISYVNDKVAQLVDSSPVTLDTLNELANALGDDPNFATTVANSIGLKADSSFVNTQLNLKANQSSISNINNTSDALKPVSSLQQTALNLKANISDMNTALANKISNNANSSIAAYLHFANNFQPYTEYNTGNFGSISVNKFNGGGFGEMDFTHNGWGMSNPSTSAFLFRIATSNTTFNELMKINKNGDTTITGTITSPTINTINSNINLKSNLTYVDSQLLLKSDLAYVNEELLKKDSIINVDSKLLLKADISSVDVIVANLQNQIDNIELTYNPIGDISGSNITFTDINATNINVSGNIVNTALTDFINTKADKNNTVLTGLSVIPTSDTHTIYCNGQIYFHGGDLANPASRIHIGSNQLMVWDNVLNEQIVYRWGPNDSVKQIFFMNGDVSIPGNILNCNTITNINNSVGLKADKTYTDSQLLLKADKTYTDAQLLLKADSNNAVLTGTANIANSNVGTINCNNQIYFYKTNVATPSSRIHIGTVNAMYWDNVLNEQIIYRWGPTNTVKQIFYPSGDISIPGNILNCNTITNINTSLSTKADKTYTDNQLLIKADKTYTDAQLLNKLSNNENSRMSAYLHFGLNGQLYTEYLNTTRFASISVNKFTNGDAEMNFIQNGFIPGASKRAFNFLLATSNTTFDELIRINKNGDTTILGTITSPTITGINTSIALKEDTTSVNTKLSLKEDTTSVNTKLALKEDTTSVNTKLATKLSNNVNSAMGAYLHFTNNSQPYTEYNSQNFGSISVNKFPSGHGSFDFIHNGFGISNLATNAFNFSIATSNTTFNSLLRITKNGNTYITGTISSPTITEINSNIALKEDTTSVNTKLNNYALLNSSPTFTGNVKANNYVGGISRQTAYNSYVEYTSATLPSVIMHDMYINSGYKIPDMPIGTRFTIMKMSQSVNLLSTNANVFFYTFLGAPLQGVKYWQSFITVTEDSRTFIRAEITDYDTNQLVQVWMTESSHTYNLNTNIQKNMIGAWMLDGAANGTINATYRPIVCSCKSFGLPNIDDGYIINEGFSLTIYEGDNYTGNTESFTNINYGSTPGPKRFNSPSLNNMQSCKLYYQGVLINFEGIS